MREAIVVFNAGSTSLKFGAYGADAAEPLSLLCRGRIDSMQGDPHFVVSGTDGRPLDTHEWGDGHAIDHKAAIQFVIAWMEAHLGDAKVIAAGHRVVLGGTRFAAPVRVNDDVLDYLDSLTTMEPSHQPYNIRGARAFGAAFPSLPQVACFDTSFHRTMPEVAQTYALPQDVRDTGVRHWGYHSFPTTTSAARSARSHPRRGG
jgi:acetate kinase